MKLYPVTIVDNFFNDPDSVRQLGLSVDYPLDDPQWPGKRSAHLSEIDRRLYKYISSKILSLFALPNHMIGQHNAPRQEYEFLMAFQKTKAYSPNKWDRKNKGWVHADTGVLFGGIIYLNPHPDKDTGTSIYRPKKGYFEPLEGEMYAKFGLYGNEDYFDDDKYAEKHDVFHQHFEETVRVNNVYNRLLLFGSDTFHGVRTLASKTKEDRLTIPFFCTTVTNCPSPLVRTS